MNDKSRLLGIILGVLLLTGVSILFLQSFQLTKVVRSTNGGSDAPVSQMRNYSGPVRPSDKAKAARERWEVMLPREMDGRLGFDINVIPNAFYFSDKDRPDVIAEPIIYRAMCRLRLERMQTLNPRYVRTVIKTVPCEKMQDGRFSCFPWCRVSEVPPGERAQAKAEFLEDVDAVLRFEEFLNLGDVPKNELEAMDEKRQQEFLNFGGAYQGLSCYYEYVVLADALNGSSFYSDRLRKLVDQTRHLDGFKLEGDIENLMAHIPPAPASGIAEFVAQQLQAMEEAKAR